MLTIFMSHRSKRDQGSNAIVPIATALATATVLGAGAVFLHKRKIQSRQEATSKKDPDIYKIAVVGPEGSGRSTLISMLTGDNSEPVKGVPKVLKHDKGIIKFWELNNLNIVELKSYHAIMHVIDDRLKIFDTTVLHEARQKMIPVFYVYTKLDLLFDKLKKKFGYDFNKGGYAFLQGKQFSEMTDIIEFNNAIVEDLYDDKSFIQEIPVNSDQIKTGFHYFITQFDEKDGNKYEKLDLNKLRIILIGFQDSGHHKY